MNSVNMAKYLHYWDIIWLFEAILLGEHNGNNAVMIYEEFVAQDEVRVHCTFSNGIVQRRKSTCLADMLDIAMKRTALYSPFSQPPNESDSTSLSMLALLFILQLACPARTQCSPTK